MLDQIAKHGNIDLNINVKGDLYVDEHHTIEDVGIALGDVFAQALGSKKGINRYGFLLPMDDCLSQVTLDFGGRSWLVWNAKFRREKIGEMPTEMFFHFFKSFCDGAKCNLNIKVEGDNEHKFGQLFVIEESGGHGPRLSTDANVLRRLVRQREDRTMFGGIDLPPPRWKAGDGRPGKARRPRERQVARPHRRRLDRPERGRRPSRNVGPRRPAARADAGRSPGFGRGPRDAGVTNHHRRAAGIRENRTARMYHPRSQDKGHRLWVRKSAPPASASAS